MSAKLLLLTSFWLLSTDESQGSFMWQDKIKLLHRLAFYISDFFFFVCVHCSPILSRSSPSRTIATYVPPSHTPVPIKVKEAITGVGMPKGHRDLEHSHF